MPVSKQLIPKIGVVCSTQLAVHFFLKDHLRGLSEFSELTLLLNPDNDKYTPPLDFSVRQLSVPIKRKISLFHDFVALIMLLRLFKREQFSLVWGVTPKAGLLAMLAAKLARVPCRVFVVQGEVWASRQGLIRSLLKNMDRITALCATHLLAVSKSEKDFLCSQSVVDSQKIGVLGEGSICGVDLERFHPSRLLRRQIRSELQLSESQPVILYVGRLNRDKGVLDLAAAFRQTLQAYPDVCLIVVGPDEENIMCRFQSALGTSIAQCRIIGFSEDTSAYMAAADFICLPSYREGFPMTILEAAACAIPAIGSKIYGISDAIVDGVTGLLFEAKSIDDLATCLIKLVGDVNLRNRLGKAAKERVLAEYEKKIVIGRYMDFFRKCLRLDL